MMTNASTILIVDDDPVGREALRAALTAPGFSFALADDGLTLPPDQLAKTWLPYYQIEKKFSGEVPGVGLGLSMVQSLAWEVGGNCQIRNRQNGPGIVIELNLPVQRESDLSRGVGEE